ncbi:MAG: hypothetical protein ACJ76S_03085 [Solirubrobacteraceae bacterium]
MARWLKVALAAGLVVAAAGAFLILGPLHLLGPNPLAPASRTKLRFQSFADDPRWQARNNRRHGPCTTTPQDFGSQGDASIGGLITRSARPAWYGRRVALDFQHRFSVGGVLVVRRGRQQDFPGGSAIVGFFNHANVDWRAPSQLGFQVNADPVNGGDYSVVLAYGARDYETDHLNYGAGKPFGFRFGRRYRWRLTYDPAGAGGRGRATLAIPEAGPPVSLALAPRARASGAALDRLGMTNQVVARGRELRVSITRLALDGVPQGSVGNPEVWQGRGNHAAFHDCLTGQPNLFGWTGPRDRRLGGLIARTDEDHPHLGAFYADRVGRLSLDDRLHAAGTVRLVRANSDSATLLGWFEAGSAGAGSGEQGPRGFIGISLTGPSRVGQYFGALVSDRRGENSTDDTPGLVLNPGPATYRWSFDYFPQSGESGVIVLRLGDRRTAWSLPNKVRRAGAVLNHFGMRNLERGGSFQVVYFDDLAYTVGADAGEGQQRQARGEDERHHGKRSRHGGKHHD